jgi:hypothetical protein
VPRKPLQEEGVRRLEQHHAKTMAGAARSRSPKRNRMSRFLTASCTSTANCISGEYCDLGSSGRRLFGAPAGTGICRSNPPSPPPPSPAPGPPPSPPVFQPMAFTTAASGSSINGAGQLSAASTTWGLSYSSVHLMTTGVYEWSITALSLTPNTANSWEFMLGMIPTTQLSGTGLENNYGFTGENGACNPSLSTSSNDCAAATAAQQSNRVVNVGDTAYFKFDGVQNKLFLREPLSSETAPYVLLLQNVPSTGSYVALSHIAISTWELKWRAP